MADSAGRDVLPRGEKLRTLLGLSKHYNLECSVAFAKSTSRHLLHLRAFSGSAVLLALLKGPGEETDAQCAHLIALEPPLRAARTHPAEIAPERRAWLTCGTKGLAGGSLCLACLGSCAHRAKEGDGAI